MHLLYISGGMGFALINKRFSLVLHLIREVKAVTEVHLFSCQMMSELMDSLQVDKQHSCNCPLVSHCRAHRDEAEAFGELEVLAHPETFFTLKLIFISVVFSVLV